MISRTILALCGAALALAPGCQTSRFYGARYHPAPNEVAVRADAVAGSQVRALVSVLGVARPDKDAGRPRQVEVRMRLENLGTVPASLIEKELSLLSADLVPFESARLEADAGLTVQPGGSLQVDMAFPAPDREIDWSGLNLRFALMFENAPVFASTPFRREEYESYPPPHWHVGFGYGYRW
jgi:hypothetical protein